jgi:glycosyltransferase involved in cell wall biosynthesis
MRHYTQWTMAVADGLHADCQRDIRLARQWGLPTQRPTLVVPGSGGIRPEVFHPGTVEPTEPVVINARGARAYVRTNTFLRAIPLVLKRIPSARFICVAMAGDREVVRTIAALEIEHAVQLLPHVGQSQLADLFRRSQVMVSPSVHDGTPNSLLEGMACDCLPVAGDLESIREWIKDGENGLLVDSNDHSQLADGILRALEDKGLRLRAAGLNRELIRQRAQYGPCMRRVDEFYTRVIADSAGASTL